MAKRKILYISFLNPWRSHADGGSEDIRRRIVASSEIYDEVHVFAVDKAGELVPASNVELPRNVFLAIYPRRIDLRPWKWLCPFPSLSRYSRTLVRDARSALSNDEDISTCVVEGLQIYDVASDVLIDAPLEIQRILRVHNIESDYHRSLARSAPRIIMKCYHRIVSIQYAMIEKTAFSAFSSIHAISESEGREIMKIVPRSIDVEILPPLPLPMMELDRPGSPVAPICVGYLGDCSLSANAQGVEWFIENVLSRFGNEYLVLLVGGRGSERFSKYQNCKAVGYVNDWKMFWAGVDIAIAPVFEGGGVKVKVVDALSMGIPLLTTEKGAEGLPEALVSQMNVSDSPDRWVSYLKRYFENYEDETHRAKEASNFVKRYGNKDSYARLFWCFRF